MGWTVPVSQGCCRGYLCNKKCTGFGDKVCEGPSIDLTNSEPCASSQLVPLRLYFLIWKMGEECQLTWRHQKKTEGIGFAQCLARDNHSTMLAISINDIKYQNINGVTWGKSLRVAQRGHPGLRRKHRSSQTSGHLSFYVLCFIVIFTLGTQGLPGFNAGALLLWHAVDLVGSIRSIKAIEWLRSFSMG